MFRVTFYVDKRGLGEALARLTGLARNVEHSYVPNLEDKPDGKLREIAGSRIELIQKELHKQKLTQISGSEARVLIEKLGLNPTSYSHFLQEMVRHGMLKKGKRDGNGMSYIVTGK